MSLKCCMNPTQKFMDFSISIQFEFNLDSLSMAQHLEDEAY